MICFRCLWCQPLDSSRCAVCNAVVKSEEMWNVVWRPITVKTNCNLTDLFTSGIFDLQLLKLPAMETSSPVPAHRNTAGYLLTGGSGTGICTDPVTWLSSSSPKCCIHITHSRSRIGLYHGLYGSTSCCISHGPCQWERAIFDPPQLRDPWTDFHETWNI